MYPDELDHEKYKSGLQFLIWWSKTHKNYKCTQHLFHTSTDTRARRDVPAWAPSTLVWCMTMFFMLVDSCLVVSLPCHDYASMEQKDNNITDFRHYTITPNLWSVPHQILYWFHRMMVEVIMISLPIKNVFGVSPHFKALKPRRWHSKIATCLYNIHHWISIY